MSKRLKENIDANVNVDIVIGWLVRITSQGVWKLRPQVYACCIRRGGPKKFHQTPPPINFPSIPCAIPCTRSVCQIVLLHILKEGRGEGFIIQTELLMVSKVHLLVQTLLVMHTRGGMVVAGGGVRRHNRWLRKTLNPEPQWSVLSSPGDEDGTTTCKGRVLILLNEWY